MIFFALFMTFISNDHVFGAPYHYYPKKYRVTIKNVNKEDIKKIEVIYLTRCGLNYEENNRYRYWLYETDFGYKYENYTDEEIIPKLSDDEITEIAISYLHMDDCRINGYWVENKYIDISTQMAKFGIYDDVDIKYYNNRIVVTYKSNDNNNYSMDIKYLRIVKKDDTVLYSKRISSRKVELVDEYSSEERYENAKKVMDEVAYFEVDYSEIKQSFDVIEVDKEIEEIHENSSRNIIFISVTVGLFILLCVVFIIIRNNKNKEVLQAP